MRSGQSGDSTRGCESACDSCWVMGLVVSETVGRIPFWGFAVYRGDLGGNSGTDVSFGFFLNTFFGFSWI